MRFDERVSSKLKLGPKGKRARNVEPLKGPRVRKPARVAAPARWGWAARIAIPAFLVLYAAVSIAWKPPLVVALGYVVASLVTFMVYAFDKSAAGRGARRTPEATLHMLALAGGWPGAILAQQLLRHKSRKAEFRSVFWVTVVLNVAGFVVFSAPAGRGWWPLP
jgi:uncharacterized membrane protein YsdA (DUF1294 family)